MDADGASKKSDQDDDLPRVSEGSSKSKHPDDPPSNITYGEITVSPKAIEVESDSGMNAAPLPAPDGHGEVKLLNQFNVGTMIGGVAGVMDQEMSRGCRFYYAGILGGSLLAVQILDYQGFKRFRWNDFGFQREWVSKSNPWLLQKLPLGFRRVFAKIRQLSNTLINFSMENFQIIIGFILGYSIGLNV